MVNEFLRPQVSSAEQCNTADWMLFPTNYLSELWRPQLSMAQLLGFKDRSPRYGSWSRHFLSSKLKLSHKKKVFLAFCLKISQHIPLILLFLISEYINVIYKDVLKKHFFFSFCLCFVFVFHFLIRKVFKICSQNSFLLCLIFKL